VTDPTALFGADGVPSITALHQGQISDCYLLAAIGSVAQEHPDKIEQQVQNDPGGGWEVTYDYADSLGKQEPVIFHTDDELSSTWQTEVAGEVWPLVMEKTYAAFRTWNATTDTSTNSMASLGWGYPGAVLTQIGEPNTQVYTLGQSNQSIYNTISTKLAAGYPVVFQTSSTAPTMVPAHVYILTSVGTDASGALTVQTYNPWGFFDTRTIADMLQNGTGTLGVGTV
jgi:hypothetical protein